MDENDTIYGTKAGSEESINTDISADDFIRVTATVAVVIIAIIGLCGTSLHNSSLPKIE